MASAANNLEAVETERPVPALVGTAREVDGGERHPDADDVGEHVAGVREQGQRVRGEPGDDLDDHEHGQQPEGGEEPAFVAASSAHRPVAVAVTAAHRGHCGSRMPASLDWNRRVRCTLQVHA